MASQNPIVYLPVQPCTQQELDSFYAAIKANSHVSSGVVELFELLGAMGYRQRYAINISRFMDCFSDHRIDNVLREGFTDFERQALAQIDQAGLTSAQVNAAHLLLGVPDRYEYLQYLKEVLPRLRIRHTVKT